jgi:hypothetical protein
MDFIDIGLYAGYALVGLCALAAILIPLVQSFDDPKKLVKSGIGVAALVVVFLISYAMADDSAEGATATASKMVGAGLFTTYVFFFGAIIGILYTEVSKILS